MDLLTDFIQDHYIEILGIFTVLILLAGTFFNCAIDPYLSRIHRQTIFVLSTLVFTLIVQNYLEYLLTTGVEDVVLRRVIASYGYSVRPVILLLFLNIIETKKQHVWEWVLAGINAALYTVSIFAPVAFWITEDNHFNGGIRPLNYTCLVVSIILLFRLLYKTLRVFNPAKRKETWIPVFATMLILLTYFMDDEIGGLAQPVSFLTIGIVICCTLYYNWLHFQFVREHERALQTEQRVQLMLSQIKPHFLHNALTAIVDLCDIEPKKAKEATLKFSKYLRGNMDSIDQEKPIPFEQELEHTRLYLEIEKLRFDDALQVEYDIGCTDFHIPVLTLEPLAENAVIHGVRENPDGRGIVRISTCEKPDHFEVAVSDNGPGFNPSRIPEDGRSHVGISNVRERLEKVCDGKLAFWTATGDGTTAVILIPKKQEEEK